MKKPHLTASEFRALLESLAASGVVRVVGSYAKGTENTRGHVSDLDLYVLRDREGMERVKAIFDAHDVTWDSIITGHIATPRNLQYAPFPVECSYLYDCQRRRVIDVSVYGVKFKAYEQKD